VSARRREESGRTRTAAGCDHGHEQVRREHVHDGLVGLGERLHGGASVLIEASEARRGEGRRGTTTRVRSTNTGGGADAGVRDRSQVLEPTAHESGHRARSSGGNRASRQGARRGRESLAGAGLVPLAARLSGSCARAAPTRSTMSLPSSARGSEPARPPHLRARPGQAERRAEARSQRLDPLPRRLLHPRVARRPRTQCAAREERVEEGGRPGGKRGRERAGLERQRVLLALQVQVSESSPAEAQHGYHDAW